jgi:hypothetical protein
MATLAAGVLTYADWAKRVYNDYKIGYIVEILSQTNEILQDMLVGEGNLPTGDKTVIRTGLPTATWRLLNTGIAPTKSTTAPITFTCGNLEAESQLDVDVAKLNGDTADFRLSEARAFIQGMNQQMAAALMYGNQTTNPERFTGLSPLYSTVSTSTAQTAYNVIDAGGTGSDNTSIWFVTWGQDTTKGIFPKGSMAGLQHQDMGKWRVQDVGQTFATGAYYWAWVDHFKWELGLAVKDWRYNVRICNIDVSDLPDRQRRQHHQRARSRREPPPDHHDRPHRRSDLRRADHPGRDGKDRDLRQPHRPNLPRTSGHEQGQRLAPAC